MDNSVEGNDNRKEEILAMSRKAQQDEGVEHAVREGAKLGNYYAIEIVSVPLFLLSFFAGHMLTVYGLVTLYGASCFGEFLAKYRILKQKRYLIAAIVFGVLGVGAAVFFLRDVGPLIRLVG